MRRETPPMKPRLLDIALIQHARGDDIDANNAASRRAIANAANDGAKLIVLQELHRSRYFCQNENPDNFDLAETIPGPSSAWLSSAAREHQIVIVGSVFERRATGLYHNTAVVLDSDGSLAGRYRKMHIPDDPGFHEKYYFTPGDLGFTPIDTRIGRLGVLVCWDQWFPEAARLMALAGAELLIYPTAIGWDRGDDETEQRRQLNAWINVQRGHAIANQLPVVACNRVGHEADPGGQTQGIDFWGNSFVCGQQGELLALADTREQILHARVDLDRTEQLRRIWPYPRDRRIDAYAGLTKRCID